MKDKNKSKFDKIEKILKNSYKEDVSIDTTFKKNLDKLVDNTIRAESLSLKEKEFAYSRKQPKKNIFTLFLRSGKLNTALFTSFLLVILLTGVAFAAVPEFRERIIPTKSKLYINSDPQGALVELIGGEYTDYVSLGITPLEKDIKAGNYTLRFSYEDYEDYERDIELVAGVAENIEIKLIKENTAIDKIKEWKTYTNLEEGFEFTYPLSWEMIENSKSEFQVEVTGENSSMTIYRNEDLLDIDLEPIEIEVNGTKYLGWENYENWRFIFTERFISTEETNYIYFAFYTRSEEEVDIYDFIRSSVAVYEMKDNNGDVAGWQQFSDSEMGFSVKYPSQDWIFIEGGVGDYYADYEIRKADNAGEKVEIKYSFRYFDELNEYLYNRDLEINGQKVKRYISGVCEGKSIYEFPNKFYLIYQVSDNTEVNEIYDKIRDNFSVLDETKLEVISDYTWMYKFTVPKGWLYNIYFGEDIIDGVEYAVLEKNGFQIQIFQWEYIEDRWNEYSSLIGLEDFYEVRRTAIKVEEREIIKNEIWMYDDGRYYMEYMIYTVSSLDEEIDFSDPAITIGDNDFVIIAKVPQIYTSDIESLISDDRDEMSVLDAIVSTFSGIE